MNEEEGMDLLIYGDFYHSLSSTDFEFKQKQLIGVKNGSIRFIKTPIDIQQYKNVKYLKDSQFLIPGLVDTHVHAPQFLFSGTGYDLDLLEWLKKYTFPREASFKNSDYAHDVYPKVVHRLLKNGTTCASYFATTHTDASIILAETCHRLGVFG